MSRRRQFEQPTAPCDIPANNIPGNIPPGLASSEVGKREAPEATPCPGPCNRAWRVAELAALEERTKAAAAGRLPATHLIPHGVTPRPGRPVWCVDVDIFNDKGEATGKLDHHGCTRTIIDRLGDLPDFATWLSPGKLNTPRNSDIDKTRSKGGGAKSIAHAPSPSPGWDTADELIRWLISLEDWLRALVRDDPNPAVFRSMTQAVRYLVAHQTPMLADRAEAEQVGLNILATHHRLEHLVGQDRLVHRLTEPCPRCARKGLRRHDGKELVKCTSCRAVWNWDHFEWLAKSYAETVKGSAKGVSA
jgi:hypothetical protein